MTTTIDADTAVRELLRQTVTTWTAQDAAAFAALYAPDATVILANGAYLTGREEIRAFMAQGFAGRLAGTRGYDEPVSVRVLGDGAAAVVVSDSSYLRPQDSEPAPELLRRATWTLSRHDGRWLIDAYHSSVPA